MKVCFEEIIPNVAQKYKKMGNVKKRSVYRVETMKSFNICNQGSGRKREKNGIEATFEKITSEKFPGLVTDYNPQD